MRIKIYDIEWDTDGEDVDLPSEIIVETDNDDPEYLSDLITDEYGFCHKGFRIEKKEK